MTFLFKIIAITSLLLCTIFKSTQAQTHCNDIQNEVKVQDLCTRIKTYKSEQITGAPILVVALHGDSPFSNPAYQYQFAKSIAAHTNNVVSIGLLRPGYTDNLARKSDGVRGQTVGDNFDNPRVLQIAGAIETLRKHYHAASVIVAGHSGGAAITAKIIALRPQLVSHAVIVSCPCNINAWRKDMFASSKYEGFKGNIAVPSPIELAPQIAKSTSVTIITSSDDKVAKPYLSYEYQSVLSKFGVKNHFLEIKGGHNIFLSTQVLDAVKAQIATMNDQL